MIQGVLKVAGDGAMSVLYCQRETSRYPAWKSRQCTIVCRLPTPESQSRDRKVGYKLRGNGHITSTNQESDTKVYIFHIIMKDSCQ